MSKNNGIFDGLKIVATAMGLLTAGAGTAFYISDLENQIKLEQERRADNELIITNLEGDIAVLKNRLIDNEIKMQIGLVEIRDRTIDNRVMLSDWIAEVNHSENVAR